MGRWKSSWRIEWLTRIGNGPAEGLVEPIKEGFVLDRMGGVGPVWRENWLHDNKRCIGKYNNQIESV